MASSFDYRAQLITHLVAHAKESVGCQLIENNSNGEQPDFPFITYAIISPFIPVHFDDRGEELFECVLSLTIHDDSALDALNIAAKYRKSFLTEDGITFFKNNSIVVVSARPSSSRDNFISIDYERLAGFDLRLRLRDNFVDESGDVIEKIEF